MLELVLAPDPIYKITCSAVETVDDDVRDLLEEMMQILRAEHAMGLGAPMVGLTQRLVVVELEDESGKHHSYKMVNPKITERSAETRTTTEASITFLGISAPVTRPAAITVTYLDETGVKQTLEAQGILATCLQHEIDYLDGRTFLDYQPPVKRDMLRRKLEKEKRIGLRPHVHGPNCSHG
jgi:peptide deformylase